MKVNETLEILRKSQEELDQATDETEKKADELTDDQKLEKAFDEKMADLVKESPEKEDAGEQQSLFKANDDEEKDKKKKKKKGDEDEDEDDKAAEGKGEGEQPNLFKKSMDKASKEVVEAMDIEPFLKSVVTAIDKQFQGIIQMIKSNSDAVTDTQEVLGRMTEFMVSQGQLVKSSFNRLTAIGDTPQPRQSKLTVHDRFNAGNSEKLAKSATDYDRAEVSEFLRKAGEKDLIKSFQIAKCESRMSKGQPLPDDILLAMEKMEKADK